MVAVLDEAAAGLLTGYSVTCVGLASAAATHNGQFVTLGQGGDPSHGAHGAEIKMIHAACPH